MSEIKGKVWKEKLKTDSDFAFANKKNHTPHTYIDIAGGLVEGTLLTQILYWCGNDKDEAKDKLRVFRNGEYWLAKGRENWWEEVRITPRQFDTAVKNLKKKNLIDTALFHFGGVPTIHVRPLYEEINNAIDSWKEEYQRVIDEEDGREKYVPVKSNLQNCKLTDCENNNLQNSEMEMTDSQNANNININNISNTETTNRDYDTDNTYNSLSTDKDNSKTKVLELYNSPVSEETKQETHVSKTLGRKTHTPKQTPLKDVPIRAREIADRLVDDTETADKVSDCISYFLEQYKAYRHREHINLTNDKLHDVVVTMLSTITIQHENDSGMFESDYNPLVADNVGFADIRFVIDEYFDTQFREKTDYSLVYFTQEGVLTNVMNRCMLGGNPWYESHSL